jgi:hypothetical protein
MGKLKDMMCICAALLLFPQTAGQMAALIGQSYQQVSHQQHLKYFSKLNYSQMPSDECLSLVG